uniref:AlNc14C51G4019 protein n=1 Tax=Albugo laibachii Nc14 TaxID=890382 RepID=F0WBH2_9STRA|nr:AlNc14C51G4019 [Albugo laibachii Nc14]|eukprot:CCA18498.1 AlNc14C51G4019 [Albugo laibachii Nc14]
MERVHSNYRENNVDLFGRVGENRISKFKQVYSTDATEDSFCIYKSKWVVIYSLTCGISHAEKSSKLTCHIRPSATGVEKCKKCILQQAGATDIVREQDLINLTCQVFVSD